MGATKTKEKHPKGFYACCITFMFERLAFYGAKPLLLLFLITAVAEGGLGIWELRGQTRRSWLRI